MLKTLVNTWVNIWVIAFLLIGSIGITWWEIMLGIILGVGLFFLIVDIIQFYSEVLTPWISN